jgi:hypothetical protein
VTVELPEARLELIGEDLSLLLEEIQLSFWIDFDPEDVIAARTVGDLFDCVIRKMGGFKSSRCLSSVAFFRLRRSLVDLFVFDRRSIRRTTSLRNLLPPPMRGAWWDVIETGLRFRVPPLRPSRAAIAAYSAIVVLGLVTFAVIITKSVAWDTSILIEVGAPLLIWALVKAASRLPREFPAETLQELVRVVVMLNQRKLADEAGGSTVTQAWNAFQQILGSASGIEAASITREMSFPEDLGTAG